MKLKRPGCVQIFREMPNTRHAIRRVELKLEQHPVPVGDVLQLVRNNGAKPVGNTDAGRERTYRYLLSSSWPGSKGVGVTAESKVPNGQEEVAREVGIFLID